MGPISLISKRAASLGFWILLLWPVLVNAQKPLVTAAEAKNWAMLGNYTISPDGRFVAYSLHSSLNDQVVLTDTAKYFRLTIPGSQRFVFTGDSHYLVSIQKDSLVSVDLLSKKKRVIAGSKFNWQLQSSKKHFIVTYRDLQQQLILVDLIRGSSEVIKDATDCRISEDGRNLFLLWSDGRITWRQIDREQSLTTGPLQGRISHLIAHSPTRSLAILSDSGLFLFQNGNLRRLPVPARTSLANDAPSFDKTGNRMFYRVSPPTLPAGTSKADQPVIWNYRESRTPGEQANYARSLRTRTYLAVTDLSTGTARLLQEQKEALVGDQKVPGDYLLFKTDAPLTAWYLPEERASLSVISVANGQRQVLTDKITTTEETLSPSGKYAAWYEPDSRTLRWYDAVHRQFRNLTVEIPAAITGARYGQGMHFLYGIAGWLGDDLLVYDHYDIWQVSPGKPVLNLTRGEGLKNRLVFSISGQPEPGKYLILSAFNPETKENGFWQLLKGKHPQLIQGQMAGYASEIVRTGNFGNDDHPFANKPLKADGANVWLMRRENAVEAPNLWVTTDLIHYKQLSDIQPQLAFNWMTVSLHSYRLPDGSCTQGVLYKPENFDPKRKYPLIFWYYASLSNQLNKFRMPDYPEDRLDIPTFVSKGYLVFMPDNYYSPGYNGAGVTGSIESAVKYLSQFPWVDTTRLGLQGHSFGGWETNYLVTHSHRFKAACEAAGVTDQISAYGQFNYGSDVSRQYFYEVQSQGSPYGIGKTPWTVPDRYIDNSPVLRAGEVSTPLLMMHNDHDASVPFAQAIEFFLALKRAGKQVWLLQYPGDGHSVHGENKKDYGRRMEQFFDHYLMGDPHTNWMINDR